MKRFNNKILLIAMICCIFILTGCSGSSSQANKEGTDNGISSNQTDKQGNEGTEKSTENARESGAASTDTNNSNSAIAPAATSDLIVYTVNSNEELEAVTTTIPEGTKITPLLIIDKVVEIMQEQGTTIGIQSISTQKDIVVVNFASDKVPANGKCTEGMEEAILNAIAQSITENLPDYSNLIFQEDGKAYEGGYLSFKIDEPYF